MASSIEAQLQAIKASLKGREDFGRRPIVRPSVLFDAREASDIDLRSILPISISGLDVLLVHDARFGDYRNTLYSFTSLDLDREKMDPKEELKLNKSVCSYLRLLSGYLHLPAALKTLEYMIRRYRVHVFNVEELILCALPHHDAHAFVRIVQLLELGNNKWAFLEAVKSSGAPPPRKIIVDQCLRDKGVFEAICNYGLPTKVFRPPKAVICFCTAVIVEALGAVKQLDSDTVKIVIPFVFSGLNPDFGSGEDNKAGALMVVGLLASRGSLSIKLSNSLIHAIGRTAHQDSKELSSVPWLQLALMSIAAIIQTQTLLAFPKRTLKCLIGIRDFTLVVKSLSQEFRMTKFLLFLIEALIDLCPSDASCCHTLSSIIESASLSALIDAISSKVLSFSVSWARNLNVSDLPKSGSWAREIFASIDRAYPSEWRKAISKFLENSKVHSKEENDPTKTLSLIIDGSLDTSFEISDSKIWFALEHPKPAVRRAALSGLSALHLLETRDKDNRKLINFQNAIMCCLQDDDLNVVKAALSIEGLAGIVNTPRLMKILQDLVIRCLGIINTGNSNMISNASEVTLSCLEFMASNCSLPESSSHKEVATLIFPFLLIHSKTWKFNIKALLLAKNLKWAFYSDSLVSCRLPLLEEVKDLEPSDINSMNHQIVGAMAMVFLRSPELHIEWLTDCCNTYPESLKLFLSVLLQTVLNHKGDSQSLLKLFRLCHLEIKLEWQLASKEFSVKKLDKICNEFSKGLASVADVANGDIIISIYWSLLKAFSGSSLRNDVGFSEEWNSMLKDLFIFFVTSPLKDAFREHLLFLLGKCCSTPAEFLSICFTSEGSLLEVRLQSLSSFAAICSTSDGDKLQLLSYLPSLLVPLSDEDKDVRASAMACVEELYKILQNCDASKVTYGHECISKSHFGEFLEMMIDQKLLILSDASFLSSFLIALFIPSQSLLLSEDIVERFDQEVKDKILTFILTAGLKISSFGKFRVLALFKRLGNSLLKFSEVRLLRDELLKRRTQSFDKLLEIEIQILCLLLEISVKGPTSESISSFIEALKVDGRSDKDPGIIKPCISVLRSLTSLFFDSLAPEAQEELFGNLVVLYHSSDDDIRNAARGAIIEINVNSSLIIKFLQVLGSETQPTGSTKAKRMKQSRPYSFLVGGCSLTREKILPYLSSILDILLLKKEMKKREALIEPLFMLLQRLLDENMDQVPENSSESELSFIKQTILFVLQDITNSALSSYYPGDDFIAKFDVKLLLEYAQSTKDVAAVNLVFSLLSSAAKISQNWVSEHIFELFSLIGHSAARQMDGHSQKVAEEFISALVPCWLSTSYNLKEVLQVFVKVLPEIPEERRLSLMVHLLRTLDDKSSLGMLVCLLLHSISSRKILSFQGEWEYNFTMKLFDQYPCQIWLPSLVILLQETGINDEESLSKLLLSLHFILQRLHDTGFIFAIESEGDSGDIQNSLRVLMVQVILLLKIIDNKETKLQIRKSLRKQLKESILSVTKCISEVMTPSQVFKAIGELLSDADQIVKKKALRLLSQTITSRQIAKPSNKRSTTKSFAFIDESSAESFCELCSKIIQLVDQPLNESSYDPVRVVAVSSLEVLANAFPTSNYISATFLAVVVKHITSDNLSLSSSCLQSTGSLISVLGSKMLHVLPYCMQSVLERAHSKASRNRRPVILSVLGVLDAAVKNLSGFLNPYLEGILELLILHQDYASESDDKVKEKAASLRKHVAEKIPARLLIAPLMKIFKRTLDGGEMVSISLAFEMLGTMVSSMDRSSVASYHVKIFGQCLIALDLRQKHTKTVENIDSAEDKVIDAITALTMKLTETMFKPLFIHAVDWAESDDQVHDSSNSVVLSRKISFYKLVNNLVLQHRSLFVPYFKYLIEGSVRYLADGETVESVSSRKKHKKTKISELRTVISPDLWHLRYLVLQSLYKCFLFDTGNLKFLESSNFQVLLKPIASQILVDPPSVLEQYPTLPSVDDVDESLVCCLGQMAVTVGSDDIWKPLNHEVLMHTRSEKVRARLLGLKVIKFLVEHLKEEYLVCLPETIPFLSELLEDVELDVKSLAQEILRELESLSGESLQQYL